MTVRVDEGLSEVNSAVGNNSQLPSYYSANGCLIIHHHYPIPNQIHIPIVFLVNGL